jgi:hypothetical protein
MKTTWYLSTLIFILTLLGFSQQQKNVPNQEIVVRFSNNHVNLEVAQNAIAIVKKQLQTIGINKIQVRESVDGSLKITYYSDIDVTSIEEIFSTERDLVIGYTPSDEGSKDFPLDKVASSYKLNVCEIGSNSDLESDLNGYILELTPNYERLFNPIVYHSSNFVDFKEKNDTEKTAYKLYRNISVEIDNSSHNIPEVRAGPFSQGDHTILLFFSIRA